MTTPFRRRAGAAAVLGFPLALLAADLTAPSFAHGGALVVAVAAHPARTWVFVGLRMVVAVLLIGTVAAVVASTRRRGSRLAHVAAALGVLGALGQAQDAAYQLFVLSMDRLDPAQAGAQLTRLDRLAAPLELPLLLAFALALVLLVAAAWRTRTATTWAFVAALVALLAHFVPGMVASRVADLLLVAAYMHTGWRLLSAADATPAPATAGPVPAASAG